MNEKQLSEEEYRQFLKERNISETEIENIIGNVFKRRKKDGRK
jgi:SOS response regulatory protein OraA/RecX